MTWFDYIAIAVLALSAAIGIWRGFVREVLALVGWAIALALAVMFAGDVAGLLPASFANLMVRQLVAGIAIFVLVLICAGFAGLLLAKLLRAAGLGVADRMFGGVFGIARGALILVVAVLAAGLTALPKEPAWRQARLSPPLETAVIAIKPYLPQAIATRVHYE